ncbi:MAG: hypothetical protein R3E77_10230 [Steroidobacteraceae bacterium]
MARHRPEPADRSRAQPPGDDGAQSDRPEAPTFGRIVRRLLRLAAIAGALPWGRLRLAYRRGLLRVLATCSLALLSTLTATGALGLIAFAATVALWPELGWAAAAWVGAFCLLLAVAIGAIALRLGFGSRARVQ